MLLGWFGLRERLERLMMMLSLLRLLLLRKRRGWSVGYRMLWLMGWELGAG
jgi:hypothetical protein